MFILNKTAFNSRYEHCTVRKSAIKNNYMQLNGKFKTLTDKSKLEQSSQWVKTTKFQVEIKVQHDVDQENKEIPSAVTFLPRIPQVGILQTGNIGKAFQRHSRISLKPSRKRWVTHQLELTNLRIDTQRKGNPEIVASKVTQIMQRQKVSRRIIIRQAAAFRWANVQCSH